MKAKHCYLRYQAEYLEDAKPCASIKRAIDMFTYTARELARYGQSIEASIHIADNRDELDEYPDYVLSLGSRGGLVKERT